MAVMRPSRFTPEEKRNIVLRHLRSETQVALHREFNLAIANA